MFKNVVVGSDPQTGGRDAFALALALADEDATITVARVFDADLQLTVPERPAIPDVACGGRALDTRHGRLSRLLFGSVPEQLTRSVAAPLLVVPPADGGTSSNGRRSATASNA